MNTKLKSITFSAEESAIADAREAAQENNTSLNEEFRKWLWQYGGTVRSSRAMKAIDEIRKTVKLHGPFSRDELNARR